MATVVGAMQSMTAFARAADERVIIAAPPDDPLAERVRKELVSMGLDTGSALESHGCTRSAVTKLAMGAEAKAVVSLEEKSLCVWIAHAEGLRLEEVVARGPEDETGNDELAVRVAEVTRANVSLAEDDRRAKPPVEPAVEPRAGAEEDTPSRSKEAPRVPRFVVGAGVGRMIGGTTGKAAFNGVAPVQSVATTTVSIEGALRLSEFLALTAQAEVPVGTTFSTLMAGNTDTLHVAPALFTLGLNLPLARVDSILVPSLGAATGFVWLHTRSELADGSADIFSPAILGDLALALRIHGPLRVKASGRLGTTAHRMVARSEFTPVANWGHVFGGVDLRAEWVFE